MKHKYNKSYKKLKGGNIVNNKIISDLKDNLINENLKKNLSDSIPGSVNNKITEAMSLHQGGIKEKIEEGMPIIEDKVMDYKKKVKKFINKISFIYFILPIIIQTLILVLPYIIIFFTFIIVVNALIMGINQLSKIFYNSLGKPLKKIGIKIKKPKKIRPIQVIVWEGFLTMFDEKKKRK